MLFKPAFGELDPSFHMRFHGLLRPAVRVWRVRCERRHAIPVYKGSSQGAAGAFNLPEIYYGKCGTTADRAGGSLRRGLFWWFRMRYQELSQPVRPGEETILEKNLAGPRCMGCKRVKEPVTH